MEARQFGTGPKAGRLFSWGDVLGLLLIAVALYTGVRLAFNAPPAITGPAISLEWAALPWYALFSVGRMTAAYILSLIFSLLYGRIAAYNPRAELVLMPLLDILQSVPILSFLPVVLLSLSAILPLKLAAELASIVLIFTSQVWNLTFAWYQSLTTVPKELREASNIFRLNSWMRFKTLELPFAGISLTWNSMMSWAGGWFFLMAAETFTVGEKDFRLAGIGSYLQQAANEQDYRAIALGLITLVAVIILLDQLLWRPLLAWTDRFTVSTVEDHEPATSWFYEVWRDSWLAHTLSQRLFAPAAERLDNWFIHHYPLPTNAARPSRSSPVATIARLLVGALLLYGGVRAAQVLAALPAAQWAEIGIGLLATLLRVLVALLVALSWTIPVGVAIGTNRRVAAVLQPLVQIAASVPATALFPVLLLLILGLPGGLNLAAVLLMLLGTQWYLLFNVIAGASAIPQDLKYTAALMHLGRSGLWKTLILPALFPFLVTGGITASGGAWNASIVAEHVEFGGRTYHVTGIGSLIATATGSGDYSLVLAATLAMVVTVIIINRLFWRQLYRLAESKYRME